MPNVGQRKDLNNVNYLRKGNHAPMRVNHANHPAKEVHGLQIKFIIPLQVVHATQIQQLGPTHWELDSSIAIWNIK
jgi:hypothetical protein